MQDFIDTLINTLNIDRDIILFLHEDVRRFSCSIKNENIPLDFNTRLIELKSIIPKCCSIDLKSEGDEPFSIDDCEDFFDDLSTDYFDIEIDKNTGSSILILSFETYCSEYLAKLNILELLNKYNEYIRSAISAKKKHTIFFLEENYGGTFENELFKFTKISSADNNNLPIFEIDSEFVNERDEDLKNIFKFSNIIGNRFYLSPRDFDFSTEVPTGLFGRVFSKLKTALSIFLLADYIIADSEKITVRYSKNTLELKIEEFDSKFGANSAEILMELFQWTFYDSFNSKVHEKLTIVRDHVSSKFTSNNYILNRHDLETIEESYNLYIVGHTKLYMETKQQITREICGIIDSTSTILDSYTSSFKGSISTAATFLFLTVGLKLFSDSDSIKLLKNNSIMDLLLLIFLFMYIHKWIAYWEFNKKLKISSEKLRSLRVSYSGCLTPSGLERIFSELNSMNSVIPHYIKIRGVYSTIWGGALLSFAVIVAYSKGAANIGGTILCILIFMLIEAMCISLLACEKPLIK